jgi:microcystin-dependent protein
MKTQQIKIKILMFLVALVLAAGTMWTTPVKASEPFVGQLMIFAGNFAPRGWAYCDGQLMAISQNDALFSLLGTIYGGDGRTTFGLPDLRGRIPMHAGFGPGLSPRHVGEKGGVETVILTVNQLPGHTHALMADSGQGDTDIPTGNVLAFDSRENQYSSSAPDVAMNAGSLGNTGGSQPHDNMAPYQALSYCIALVGIYPSRN